MTTSGAQVQLEELIPVDTHEAKYDFVAHDDVKPDSANVVGATYTHGSTKNNSHFDTATTP